MENGDGDGAGKVEDVRIKNKVHCSLMKTFLFNSASALFLSVGLRVNVLYVCFRRPVGKEIG